MPKASDGDGNLELTVACGFAIVNLRLKLQHLKKKVALQKIDMLRLAFPAVIFPKNSSNVLGANFSYIGLMERATKRERLREVTTRSQINYFADYAVEWKDGNPPLMPKFKVGCSRN